MLLFYIVLYLAAIIFSKTGQHLASGLLLFMAAVGLFLHYFLKTGQVVNMPGLLSLSWVGGQAVASLKLSSLQRDWSLSLIHIFTTRNANIPKMQATTQE